MLAPRSIAASLLLGSIAAVLALLASPSRASACSCIGREPAQYVESSALAFIGRVVSVETEGRTPRTRITVLHAIHGRPGREQRIPAANDPCGRTFESGEIALVFVARDRSTSICAGNYAIEVQLARMLEYLALGPQPRAPAPREAIAAAVAPITTPGPRTVQEAGRFGSLAHVVVTHASRPTRWLVLLQLQPNGTWSPLVSSEETRCPNGTWRPARWGC